MHMGGVVRHRTARRISGQGTAAGAVDRGPMLPEPRADAGENLQCGRRKRSICLRSDVEQQVAVLGRACRQQTCYLCRILPIVVMSLVAPRLVEGDAGLTGSSGGCPWRLVVAQTIDVAEAVSETIADQACGLQAPHQIVDTLGLGKGQRGDGRIEPQQGDVAITAQQLGQLGLRLAYKIFIEAIGRPGGEFPIVAPHATSLFEIGTSRMGFTPIDAVRVIDSQPHPFCPARCRKFGQWIATPRSRVNDVEGIDR